MSNKKLGLFTLQTGIIGICLTAYSIATKDLPAYLVAQALSIGSGFLWCRYLNGSYTWDTILSLVLSIAAALSQDQWLLYSSALARSVSYQMLLVRLLKKDGVL